MVKLITYGTRLISRAEARRVFPRLEGLREVILDFRKVEEVGQGFGDETFRVWAADHPKTRIDPVNMTKEVAFMVERARRSVRR